MSAKELLADTDTVSSEYEELLATSNKRISELKAEIGIDDIKDIDSDRVNEYLKRVSADLLNECLQKVHSETEKEAQKLPSANTLAEQKSWVAPDSNSDKKSSPFYLFDPVNSLFSEPTTGRFEEAMPYFAGKILPYRQGFYGHCAYASSYNSFLGKDSESVLDKAIERIFEDNELPDENKFMCFIPDSLDNFSKVRHELFREYDGRKLICIPRSIATVYAKYYQNKTLNSYGEVYYLDYDTPQATLVKIGEEKWYYNNKEYVMPVRSDIVPLEAHCNYEQLVRFYINSFAKKYSYRFSEQEIKNVVSSKRLLGVLWQKKQLLMCSAAKDYVWLKYDAEIYEELKAKVLQDIASIRQDNSIYESFPRLQKAKILVGINFFADVEGTEFFNLHRMSIGANELYRRIREDRKDEKRQANSDGLPMWIENLPSWKLEVALDGRFKNIDLVKPGKRRQAVRRLSGTNNPRIPIDASGVVFPKYSFKEEADGLASENETQKIYLPLIRENTDEEKLACFELKEPLLENTPVSLVLEFNFNDENALKLIAKADTGEEYVSHWCDATEMGKLDNPYPEFEPGFDCVKDDARKSVVNAFEVFFNKVQKCCEHKLDEDLCYKEVDYPELSKLLLNFNVSKKSYYYSVQRFFDLQSYEKTATDVEYITSSIERMANLLNGDELLPISEHELQVLRYNIVDICQWFGYIYAGLPKENTRLKNAVQKIRKFFESSEIETYYKTRNKQYALSATRGLRLDDDEYGFWKLAIKLLKREISQGFKKDYRVLRAIAVISWQNEYWLRDFYDAVQKYANNKLLLGLEKKIKELLQDEVQKIQTVLMASNTTKKYNNRKLRDILELLLSMIRLRQFDRTILDCNGSDARCLVKILKELNDKLDEVYYYDKMDKRLHSRIKRIEVPDMYNNMNKLIYAIIELLSGGPNGPVKLMGFEDRG